MDNEQAPLGTSHTNAAMGTGTQSFSTTQKLRAHLKAGNEGMAFGFYVDINSPLLKKEKRYTV